MRSLIGPVSALLLVAACSTDNPFYVDNGGVPPDALPGTTTPRPGRAITRYEPKDNQGSGFVTSVVKNNDGTYSFDNLAFDGDNTYHAKLGANATLGPYQVYENNATFTDPASGAPINQLEHNALIGISTETPGNQFAIVRTGAYQGYGFGGFVFSRGTGVTINPADGQATYSGDYAALRDFQGNGGLEYVTGDVTMDIDFSDFNEGYGIKGQVTNRQIFDAAGNNITGDIIDALTDIHPSNTSLPVLRFTIGPGVMDVNGEINGTLGSTMVKENGTLGDYEKGKYYAVLSGAGADQEVVGVIVVTSEDPRYENVTARETGGFILYR